MRMKELAIINYDPSQGTLSNGAIVNTTTNFVDNIGGAQYGSCEVILVVDNTNQYSLNLNYLSPNTDSSLAINVNGVDSGMIYLLNQTTGDTLADVQQFNVIINLNVGTNTVVFHGDGIYPGPSIGIFTISEIMTMMPTPTNPSTTLVDYPTPIYSTAPSMQLTTYDCALGILSNGAFIDKTTNFVNNIGGVLDGASNINVNVNNPGQYLISLNYLSLNSSSILVIDVNGVNTGSVYLLSPTKENTTSSAGILQVLVYLNLGVNSILFHGDGLDIGPSIGTFSLAKVLGESKVYKAVNGDISKGASINSDTGFVDNIGGIQDGTVGITFNASIEGQYNLTITYLSPNKDNLMKIDINNITSSSIYFMRQTASVSVLDQQIFNTVINLNAGGNILTMHGEGSNDGLSIGVITITPVEISIISSPAPIYSAGPSGPVINYDVSLGILSNGAVIDSLTNFVDNIGGPKDGGSEVTVTVSSAGQYNLALECLSPYGTSNLVMSINGVDSGGVYFVNQTPSGDVIDAEQFNATINLNTGNNTILFHGDGINAGPSMGTFTITPVTTPIVSSTPIYSTGPATPVVNYDTALGLLSNGAVVDPTTNFVDNIGGTSDGSSGVTVNVNNTAQYILNLNYLSHNGNSSLTVDVNGINTGKIYTLVQTVGNAASNAEVLPILISLNSGNNTILFHGNGADIGPSIGTFSLEEIVGGISQPITTVGESTVYQAINSEISNGAIVNIITGFVDYIGGAQDGTAIITYNGLIQGEYNLAITYLSPNNNRVMKLDINGFTNSLIYIMKETASNNAIDAQTFNTVINLNFGTNTLVFHGDGMDIGPSLGSISITPITNTTISETPIYSTTPSTIATNYNTALGALSNGAVIDNVTNFVDNIGGTIDGSSQVVVNVTDSAQYNLALQYLSPNVNTNLAIDINGINTGKIYNLQQTASENIIDAQTFNVVVALQSGVNTIKFHGDGITIGPSIGSFIIIEMVNTPTVFIDLNANSGILFNGANLNVETSFVDNVGGISDGTVLLTANVPIAGNYDLGISYIAPNTNTTLKLTINNISTNTVYSIPQTNSASVSDALLYTIPVNLNLGINSIALHGDGINNSLSIGNINITNILGPISAPTIANILGYDITKGIFSNGATINFATDFVENLGGKADGSTEVYINVSRTDIYNLNISYLSPYSSSNLKIDINGIDSGNIYFVPQTTGNAVADVQVFSTIINLNVGDNTIKFYGDGKDVAPNLGKFTISAVNMQELPPVLSTPTTGNITGISLTGSATVANSFITGIGGSANGGVTLTVSIPYAGVYDLGIYYVAPDNNETIQMDINAEYTGVVYSFNKTASMNKQDEQVKVISVNLVSGINVISIYS